MSENVDMSRAERFGDFLPEVSNAPQDAEAIQVSKDKIFSAIESEVEES